MTNNQKNMYIETVFLFNKKTWKRVDSSPSPGNADVSSAGLEHHLTAEMVNHKDHREHREALINRFLRQVFFVFFVSFVVDLQ